MSFNPVVCVYWYVSFFIFTTNLMSDNIIIILWPDYGWDSVVGIVTCYGPDGVGIKSQRV
jgi:hypothetical protein